MVCRRLPNHFLGLLVATVICVSGAVADTPFEIELAGQAPIQIMGADRLGALSAALSVRVYEEQVKNPVFRIEGNSDYLSIHRFEVEWEEFDSSPVMPPSSVWGNQRIRESVVFEGPGTFRYALDQPVSAGILQAENMLFYHGPSALNFVPPARAPFLVGDNDRTMAGERHDDERRSWYLPGPHLVATTTSDMNGESSGQSRFYWTKGALVIREGSESKEFASASWTDPVLDTSRVRVHHSVWHELQSADATSRFELNAARIAKPAVLLARELAIHSAETISFDSSSSVTGTLPEATQRAGRSLWIMGNVSTSMQAVDGTPAGERPRYDAMVWGLAAAVSSGGEPATWLSDGGTVAGLSLLALLVVAAVLFRDALADVFSRTLVVLYAKLKPEHVLRSETRAFLLGIIKGKPGIHFSGIREAAAMMETRPVRGTGLLLHHLAQLEATGNIVSHREGRFRRYFAVGSYVNGDVARVSLLKTDPVNRIAKWIHEHPGCSQTDIRHVFVKNQNMVLSTLQYHLARLVRTGLAQAVKAGRRRLYVPSDHLKRLIGLIHEG